MRRTIAVRGTIRMLLAPITLVTWVLSLLALLLLPAFPLGALASLLVLAAGYETILALHVGVERIGRYLQVFYEEPQSGPRAPRWETAAMTTGPALPGGGVDPLFSVLFGGATLLNLLTGFSQRATPIDVGLVLAVHGAFLVRLVRARRTAGRQRQHDLEAFRRLRDAPPAQAAPGR